MTKFAGVRTKSLPLFSRACELTSEMFTDFSVCFDSVLRAASDALNVNWWVARHAVPSYSTVGVRNDLASQGRPLDVRKSLHVRPR